MLDCRGAWTALVTPFSEDGSSIAFDRLTTAIRTQALAGMRGIVPCGTTGESPTLRRSEWAAMVDRSVHEGHAQGLLVMPGAGSYDTRAAIEMHRHCADAGADAALHVTPYYNRPSIDGLRHHFLSVADAADLPVVLYDVPGRTGTAISAELLIELADHPNIVAVKDATGSAATAQRVLGDSTLQVLCGDDPMTLPLMALGAVGVVSVAGNIVPGRIASLVAAMLAGRLADARAIHRELLPLATGLLGLGPNPVPLKAALAARGLDTGTLRSPLVPLDDDTTATIGRLVDAALSSASATDPGPLRVASG
ncbi:MAG: 4-hydroxy-tetrahydrodipicolinate synthase [Phycisphaerales bacterium]